MRAVLTINLALIGSEFHIITHNESFQLPTIKVVIIVATIGDCPFNLISIGYISVSLPLTSLTAVIALIEIKLP